jgi:YidC/Oxa1 family membrane protein insertase
MSAFFQLFANILAWFYSLIPNFAISIILLTLLVMIIVTPLTLKGTRSMMIMQQLQPEMRKIQQRYKDDRQKLNEELLKFYKENDISPLGGCLPLLVQAPVFIVLYQVLRGLTLRQPALGFNTGWVSGQLTGGANPVPKIPNVVRTFDPAYVNHSSRLYNDLANTTEMSAFGIDLSESASKALQQGVLHALPYLVLIAIVAVTGFVQQRQIQGRMSQASQAANPQMQQITKIMPFFLPLISFGLPAGLVLYFATSNLYRIGQQAFISRSIYGMSREEQKENRLKGKEVAKSSAKSTKAITKGSDADEGPTPEKNSGETKKTAAKRGAERKPAAKKAEPTTADTKKPSTRSQPDRKSNKVAASNGRNQKSGRTTSRTTRGNDNGDASTPPPTLQPRARKKKR